MKLIVHIVEDTEAFLLGAQRALVKASGQKQNKDTGDTLHFEVSAFRGPNEWRNKALTSKSLIPDLCLLDIDMDGDQEAGLKLARLVRDTWPQTIVVMYSHLDDADTVLRLMAAGADSFISKKSSFDELPSELIHAYRVSLRKRPSLAISPQPSSLHCAGATLEAIEKRIPHILNSAVRAIHVEGETGTGKEVVADLFEAALQSSGRKPPFIRVNCGAFSSGLVESELLGHRKGAFTGADSDRAGYIEAASGGWLFLDEVATLSAQAQVTLLRVIENQTLTRIGETRERRIQTRFLSACNENLEARVHAGTFRRDLWQRLTETRLTLPPLRERKQEIESLISHFCRLLDGGPYLVTPPTFELLKRSDWTEGNVRELRNCLRAMTEYAESPVLGPNTIPSHVFESIIAAQNAAAEILPSRQVTFEIKQGSCDYDKLEETLFVWVVKAALAQSPRPTLRMLESATGICMSTLRARLKESVRQGSLAQHDFPESFWTRNFKADPLVSRGDGRSGVAVAFSE